MTQTSIPPAGGLPAASPADRQREITALADALAGLPRFQADPVRARAFGTAPAVRAAVAAHLDAVDGLWRIMTPPGSAPAPLPAPPPVHAAETPPPPSLASRVAGNSATANFFAETFTGSGSGALTSSVKLPPLPSLATRNEWGGATAEAKAAENGIKEPATPKPDHPPSAPDLLRHQEPRQAMPEVPATPVTSPFDPVSRPSPWAWGRPETMTLSHMSLPPAALAALDAFGMLAPAAPPPVASPLAAGVGPATVSTSALGQPNFEVVAPARVGTLFHGGFGAVGPGGRRARVLSVQVPPELGLGFDTITQTFAGTPLTAGMFTLPLQWTWLDTPGDAPRAGNGTLRVAENPGGAWQPQAAAAPGMPSATAEPGPAGPDAGGDDALTLLLDAGTGARQLLAATLRTRPNEPGLRDDFFLGCQGGWNLLALTAATAAGEPGPNEPTPVRDGALLALSILTGEAGRQAHLLLGQQAVVGWRAMSPQTHSAIYRVAYDALCHGAHRIRNSLKAAAPEAAGAAGAIVLVAHREVVQGQLVLCFHSGTAGVALLAPRQGLSPLSLAPEASAPPEEGLFTDADALTARLTVALVPHFEALVLGAGSAWLDEAERWNGLWPSLQAMLRRPAPEPAALEWLQNRRPTDRRPADQSLMVLWPG